METESKAEDRTTGGALRRMVRPAPPPRGPAPEAGGLVQAMPRVVDQVMGLPVRLGRRSDDALSRDDLAEALPQGALILRLRGADDAAVGLAWLEADLFTGLVERRLTGGLRTQRAEARPPTPLDAVICAELVDALCGEPGVLATPDIRTDGHMRDPDLAVEFPEIPYRLTRLPIVLGRTGERGGELALALADVPPPAEEEDAAQGVPRTDLGACPATMEAALPSVTLTWARVTTLGPGDVVALPEGAIDAVRVLTIAGTEVAGGRLGRLGDHRAVRVQPPCAAEPAALGPAGAGPMAMDAIDMDAMAGDAMDPEPMGAEGIDMDAMAAEPMTAEPLGIDLPYDAEETPSS